MKIFKILACSALSSIQAFGMENTDLFSSASTQSKQFQSVEAPTQTPYAQIKSKIHFAQVNDAQKLVATNAPESRALLNAIIKDFDVDADVRLYAVERSLQQDLDLSSRAEIITQAKAIILENPQVNLHYKNLVTEHAEALSLCQRN